MPFQAQIKIHGINPLLLRILSKSTEIMNPESWKNTIPHTSEGQLYFCSRHIFACLRAGALLVSAIPFNKRGIQGLIATEVQLCNNKILLDRWIDFTKIGTNSKELVYFDTRLVKDTASNRYVLRKRVAVAAGWSAEFTLKWSGKYLGNLQLQEALVLAGERIGIGNGRRLGLGRFQVVTFQTNNL